MQFLSRFARNRGALVGAAVIVGLLLVALLAPMLTPHDPTAMNPAHRLQAPGKDYPLGTDQFGRDQLTRLLYGARTSLSIGLITTGIAATFGIALGVLAGFVGGAVDRAVTMLMDIVFSFPAILLAVAIVAMMGPSLPNVMIAIGIVNIPVFGRIVRAATLSVSSMAYVEAAVALGNRRWAIVFRHILPNVLAPIMVQASLTFAFAILSEAGLSFIGLGAQPPTPSWGLMLREGRMYLNRAPWLAVWPGLFTMVTVLAFNLVGDGLRDTLDPRLKR